MQRISNKCALDSACGAGRFLFGSGTCRLSYGPPTSRQNKMTLASIIFMFVVMVLVGGPHFGNGNYRLVWLGAFLAIGLHFVPMAWCMDAPVPVGCPADGQCAGGDVDGEYFI